VFMYWKIEVFGVFAYLVPYKFFSKKQVSADSEKTICKALMKNRCDIGDIPLSTGD